MHRGRWELWDCLRDVEAILGWLRVILISSERTEKVGGLMRAYGHNDDFNDCIQNCELSDLPFEGAKFS